MKNIKGAAKEDIQEGGILTLHKHLACVKHQLDSFS